MKHFFLLMVLMFACLFQAAAQNRTVSGRVTDRANGQGLPGVGVIVKGTTIGTSTNVDGAYSISVPASATILSFQFIGYTTTEQPIRAGAINVALAPDTKQLGEVVVTGALGIQRQEREVGYATATLDTKEITQARVNNVTNGLAGKVSGLQVQTISSGVNPQVRVTLRGTRSLTGNNEALIVIDGIISTNDALVALNPDDISNISVLKGANAAALYGSQASNGALIVTTKKGTNTAQVTLSQTSQFESVSFLPKLQNEFGPGAQLWGNTLPQFPSNNETFDDTYAYNSMENQQFGPRYNGTLQPFGEPLGPNKAGLQQLTYNARPDEKNKFWNTGFQVQNGITFSGGDERTKFYASYQNVHNNGIVPKDKYDRNTFRLNASREIGRLTVGFNMSYAQQKVDQSLSPTGDASNSVYYSWFNTSSMAPLTSYKDWQNNPYANPNGYYNAFYKNPYYVIDNNRYVDRRNTVLGNIDLSYRFTDWLRFQYRIGTTNIDQTGLFTQNKFVYNSWVQGRNTNKSGATIPGFVQDIASYQRRINSDAFLSMDKTFGDINVKAILGNNVQQFQSRYNNVSSTALAVPDLFNLSNRIGQLAGGDATYTTRIYAFYADLTLGYKDFFFLHGSGRNDNISVLDANNRSFFYPGVDASLVFSNAIPALKDVSWLDYGKLRGGYTKVSQVNLGNTATTFGSTTGVAATGGAYALQTPFNPGAGFPFGTIFSYTLGNNLVQPGLIPETTYSTEAGLELSFFKRRVAGAVTYYTQQSKGQTISTQISPTSGFTSLLLNAGEVRNRGIEADLNITPVRLENGLTITLGANFNYNVNEVVSLPAGVSQLNLSTGGNSQLVALAPSADGTKYPYPMLVGSHYARTADGQVKLAQTKDPNTGEVLYYPVKAADNQVFGNTQPKYKYGFNASISYKGLTLSGQGELRTGYVIYNGIGEDLDFTGSGARSAMYGRQNFVYPNSAYTTDNGATYISNDGLNGRTQVKTPGGAEFWAQNSTWNRTVAENYVTSGTFFKIRELSLSYALPAAVLSNIGFVKGLSLNVYGRNILTWVPKENIYTDPEFSFSNSNAIGINTNQQTPPTKFYGASLNATF
jgi:TonB-linked SusC/RagA family outer membrane protein